ncbi:MAG: universal stress protein [bacterium]|nr:universal stress protein [bacterium]
MNLPNIRIKKILYTTDLSESAVHAYAYAVSLANLYGAGIAILHVLAEFPGEQFITNMINTNTWEEIKNRHYSKARDQLIGKRRDHVALKEVLEAFSEEAKADGLAEAAVTDEVLIKPGTPAEVIVDTAQELNCDLIVMGTHGHSALADVLIGSTAKWVVRNSPIPVLVIRLP